MDVEKYAKANEAGARRNFEIVSKLRKAYPYNRLYCVYYGKVASEMNSQFEIAVRVASYNEVLPRI